MTESTTADLPRSVIASRFRELRNRERNGPNIIVDRGMDEYITHFMGLKSFFDYVHKLGSSKLVLDIGAGKTKAISQIEKSKLGKGLEFKATVLAKDKEIVDKYLGSSRTITTSAESLRGVNSESVAGILAMYSITYSYAPRLAIERMDQVLVPGGIIKATFGSTSPEAKFTSPTEFINAWKDLGYDTFYWGDIALVIKPGASGLPTAGKVFSDDWQYFDRKQQRLF